MKTSRAPAQPYITRDGSEIRELMHPAVHGASHGVARQSLAEATVLPGQKTHAHRHRVSEELYHFTSGHGRVMLGTRTFDVDPGDTVCIAPGVEHSVENTGTVALTFLCMCAPAYVHTDTELTDAAASASFPHGGK